MPEKKENFHILIPMWGRKFIDYSINFGLKSLFAPGNLPWLASKANLTLVFLTLHDDIEYLGKIMSSTEIPDLCAIEYEPIDDLVMHGESIGMSINLALVRGVTRQKEKMTSTRFIFFNADFIIADGSLKKIWSLVEDGNDVILGTSFRVTENKALEPLQRLFKDYNGAIPPRELAQLALRHKHHTVISKTLNQEKYHCLHYNQAYWHVDEATLLARCFLPTLFCLKPTAHMQSIDSFIDYNMIPRFCPGAKMAAITDSDDFFLLEMQDGKHETVFLRTGGATPAMVAQSIAAWRAPFHKEAGSFETVIHGSDLPANLQAERLKFQEFMQAVEGKLPSESIEPATHHHWIGAIKHWLGYRMPFERENGKRAWPFSGISMPLCPLDPAFVKRLYPYDYSALEAAFLGTSAKAKPWHPLAVNFAAIKKMLAKNLEADHEYLFVADDFTYDGVALSRGKAKKALALDVMNGHLGKLYPGRKFSFCFIAVRYEDLDVNALLENIKDFMLPNSKIALFFGREFERLTPKNRPFMDAYFCAMQDLEPYSPAVTRSGNLMGIDYVRWMEDALRNMRANPLWHGPRLFFLSLGSMLNNLYCTLLPNQKSYGATGIIAEFKIGGERK